MILDGAGNVSYEPPFHNTCVSRDVMLYKENKFITWVSLDSMGLGQMPDVIINGGLRYRYGGVSDGRGIYQQIEE